MAKTENRKPRICGPCAVRCARECCRCLRLLVPAAEHSAQVAKQNFDSPCDSPRSPARPRSTRINSANRTWIYMQFFGGTPRALARLSLRLVRGRVCTALSAREAMRNANLLCDVSTHRALAVCRRRYLWLSLLPVTTSLPPSFFLSALGKRRAPRSIFPSINDSDPSARK